MTDNDGCGRRLVVHFPVTSHGSENGLVGADRLANVVSPSDPDGPELLLEPDTHPAVQPYKQALVADGIPATSFAVDNVSAEVERLRALGVRFTQEPLEMGPVVTAVSDDTYGNLIHLAERK